jgi:DNA repair photolyase
MTTFDDERTGTGTAEWAEVNENICLGCSNNCLYCYAAYNANRFGKRLRADWAKEELTKRALITSYPARNGVVMFPSSHDITPFNLEAYIRVARLILSKGNQLLIVSKPRYECIVELLKELSGFKSQILFRFTIGTLDGPTSEFWEPDAPCPLERGACLTMACCKGFRTSVSIEPMLEGIEGVTAVVCASEKYVTDTIWVGKMNKIRLRVNLNSVENVDAVQKIEWFQRDSEIIKLYNMLFDNKPNIRWKDSIKTVLLANR